MELISEMEVGRKVKIELASNESVRLRQTLKGNVKAALHIRKVRGVHYDRYVTTEWKGG